MVRMTIACARCRKLKIKCVHTGEAPCRNCAKKGPAEVDACTLSEPVLKQRTPRRASTKSVLHQSQNTPRQNIDAVLSSPVIETTIAESEHRQHDHSIVCHESRDRDRDRDRDEEDVFSSVGINTVLSTLSLFHQKFPELRFLHLPSITHHVRSIWNHDRHQATRHGSAREKLRLLCAAVMALCSSSASTSDRYADYVRDRVAVSLFTAPDLITVQTLLVLAMYEWGMGQGYRAWMYAGAASRMMQSLLVLWKPSSTLSIEREERSRTFWGCFVMDRMVFCGQPQPWVLSMYASNVKWPSGEQDYVFGPAVETAPTTDTPPRPIGSGIDHYYSLLVRGFDIWARVLQFVVNGGRRQPGLCRTENHPWMAGSPWRLPYDELQLWRTHMDRRLKYPETAVAGHAVLGNGNAEQFAYINLIYYISVLFLGREYIPFLPTPEATPVGPVDPPLLTLQAPSNWWADRAAELFDASVHIVTLLKELADAGAALDSPFAGFCSFSAATMNLYILHFPNMNLGRSTDTPAVVADNLAFLESFQAARPMGRGWWVTIQHCQALYASATHDRSLFAGRTRADFEALEYSIHDVRGQPPKEGASLSPVNHPPPGAGQVNLSPYDMEVNPQNHFPVVVAGPSGVGKSTICDQLKHRHPNLFCTSVSHTTRNKRPGEVDGKQYHFVSEDTFRKMFRNGDFLEDTYYDGHHYGTSRQTITEEKARGKIVLLDVNLDGVRSLKKSTAVSPRFVFIRPVDIFVLEKRLRSRNTETEHQIQSRLALARFEMEYACETGEAYNKIIVNDCLETAVKEFEKFIFGKNK
ncbi:hypothetical protein SBRCBS47491_007898 [Sporothrix bragantina]|uniref:guanylate kinase n=1 Tax=Sporothrix bragantina TaxID=671064 RepID=A0ABP0CHI3_9PEZI